MKCFLAVFSLLAVSNLALANEDQIPGLGNSFPDSMSSESSYDGSTLQTTQESPFSKFNLTYFAIFSGPSVKNPSPYQPTTTGRPDLDRPIMLRNFLGLGYNLSDQVNLSANGYWLWEAAPRQQVSLQDPFIRATYNSIFRTGTLNLYGDIRAHLPITQASRDSDMRLGLQAFQYLSYDVPETPWTLGIYASERTNIFGKQGYGDDLSIYFAPNFTYQIAHNLSLLTLFEFQTSHRVGTKLFPFSYDGFDIQPGLMWNVTPQFLLNPYLTVFPGRHMVSSTSFGMMVSWVLM